MLKSWFVNWLKRKISAYFSAEKELKLLYFLILEHRHVVVLATFSGGCRMTCITLLNGQ